MKLKKHLNNISALALAPLCLLGLLGNEPKQMKASAIGNDYKTYSEEITFSLVEKNNVTEYVTNISLYTTFSCEYKVNDGNIYVDNVSITYDANFYDGNTEYFSYGTFNVPMSNEVYVKPITDINSLYFKVRTQYDDGDSLDTMVLYFDYLGRPSASDGMYLYPSVSYIPDLNTHFDRDHSTKLIDVIKAEIDGYNYGYNIGYEKGHADGYDYAENMTLEHHGFEMLLNSIFSAPAYMFATAFNFEIFGINVKNILLLFLTIGLVIMAIGIFKSKE